MSAKKHIDEDSKYLCEDCPMSCYEGNMCAVIDLTPDLWKINDEVQKALL